METPTFTCLPCNFTTSLKANLVRHQNTAKHVKICECQEVVTKTVIEVVNTENKEPINSVNNQILDKVEELTKKNESLEETIKKLIDEGGILNELNKEISIETIVDQSKFINTIIYALETRYKMIFTIDEIKRELNMLGTKKIFREPLKEDIKKIKVLIKRINI